MRGRGIIRVTLIVVEVKGLLAGAVVRAARRTLDHGEAQLHVDLRGSATRYQFTAQPMTSRAVALTDLIRPHAVVLLVQTAHFLPQTARLLQRTERDYLKLM